MSRTSQAASGRTRGHRGGEIPTHRAIVTLGQLRIVGDGFLALGIVFAWFALLPTVCRLWEWLSRFLVGMLGLPAQIRESVIEVGTRLALHVPYIDIQASQPGVSELMLATALTAIVLIAALALPRRFTPLRFLLFIFAFIQGTAVGFFALFPQAFARDLTSYLETMMVAGLSLVSLVPVIFAFTYYVLEPSFARKAGYTLLCMAHLVVFVPAQFALHAYIVHAASFVALPVLYVLFGLFLDVFLILTFYALAVGAIREGRPAKPESAK